MRSHAWRSQVACRQPPPCPPAGQRRFPWMSPLHCFDGLPSSLGPAQLAGWPWDLRIQAGGERKVDVLPNCLIAVHFACWPWDLQTQAGGERRVNFGCWPVRLLAMGPANIGRGREITGLLVRLLKDEHAPTATHGLLFAMGPTFPTNA